jgi:glutaredoxin 3
LPIDRFAGLHYARHILLIEQPFSECDAERAMPQVEIYTTMFCPYCARARALLERKGVDYAEIDIIEEPMRRDEMIRRAGGRTTVPQIFIDGEHIGGCDDMVALDRAGKLDPKLGISA